MTRKNRKAGVDRRQFMGGAIGAAGATLMAAADAQQPPAGAPPAGAPRGSDIESRYSAPPSRGPQLFRAELDITDCEVEGRIPADLDGAFYRVGPDAQYPLRAGNIPFDGEGHVSMFRFQNGHVNLKTRFVRNERYLAQEKAGKILFPMYRNPYMDDPSVKGLSRGTHNTHIIHHNGLLLALKEDSPPAAMDLNTLATVDPVYTFKGQLQSKTFTAHPKTDSRTGNLLGFGYEAKGHNTTDVNVFEYTPDGRKVWDAWVNVPYVGMLHDYQVTENFVMLYVIPLAIDEAQIARGGIHWSWYSGQPTYFGYFRRGGDGKDIKWIKGPERSATHMMGGFDDGKRLYVDVEMSLSNPFPFMPMRDGSRWDPVRGAATSRGCRPMCRRRIPRTTRSRRCIRTTSGHCRGRTIATTRCPTATVSCPAPIRILRIRPSARPRAMRVSTFRTAARSCSGRRKARSWPRPALRRRARTRPRAWAT